MIRHHEVLGGEFRGRVRRRGFHWMIFINRAVGGRRIVHHAGAHKDQAYIVLPTLLQQQQRARDIALKNFNRVVYAFLHDDMSGEVKADVRAFGENFREQRFVVDIAARETAPEPVEVLRTRVD